MTAITHLRDGAHTILCVQRSLLFLLENYGSSVLRACGIEAQRSILTPTIKARIAALIRR